ncbi:MAG: lipopolysaccharide biosynthesis protein, partial [Candidatus Firestonebacteria bacterium]|nr:lipopolysaccharide biosynthesis protein [Candidatus Firestonebacteria bacterium]
MPQQNEQYEDNEISLIELLAVIVKHRWVIICITFLVSAVVAVYSLTLPNIYKATAKILPPGKESSNISAIAAQLPGGLASLAGGALGIKDTGELYISMLRSRSITDKIIEKFDLKNIYKAK